MSHTTNRPQMTRKKARELLPGDYAITSGQIDKILSVERQFSSDGTERVHAEITTFDGYAARADWDGNQEFWCVDTRTNWPTARLIIVFRAHERNLEPAVLALRAGMTRQQVAMEIGTPLLNNAFRTDRWDYVYEVVRGNKVKEHRNLSVYFDANGAVSRIEGNALDYAREQIAASQQTAK